MSFIPLTTADALNNNTITSEQTYNITASTKSLSGTSTKQVYGYVKDSNGNPVANKTVYVGLYDNYISSTEKEMVIDDFYDVVKTDSNGYYSLYAYETGYYEVFTSFKSLTKSEVEKFLIYGGEWPSRFLIDNNGYYACNSNAASYALIK
jgi:uncharacterized GH25 family protein